MAVEDISTWSPTLSLASLAPPASCHPAFHPMDGKDLTAEGAHAAVGQL